MYRVLAILQVRDFVALDEFERAAAVIMSDFGGEIVCGFETLRNSDGSGEEVHLLEFADEESFSNYRNDDRHHSLRPLREKAIAATDIRIQLKAKSYS